jgi:hypothetical protein
MAAANRAGVSGGEMEDDSIRNLGRRLFAVLVSGLCTFGAMPRAGAIPAFARKYGTSCLTCHTVYPKLTPFGEAFRRNGYRFPGFDVDQIKQETVALGQEAYKQTFPNSVWPGFIMNSVPIAVGFNGAAVFHPDTKSGGGAADNGSAFTTGGLIEEGHIWAGGSIDDKTTFYGELTISGGGIEIEHAKLLFNDLVGPKHAANLTVGKITPSITSFGQHSSYIADTFLPSLSVTALFGGTSDSWNVVDAYNGAEVSGVIHGRFLYTVGLNAGANLDTRPTENVYGHVGFKLGGMRLDGEGSSGAADPNRPWAERAVTVDAFLYRSASHYTNPGAGAGMTVDLDDEAVAFGGTVRAQWESLELNVGAYQERHDHILPPDMDGNSGGVNATTEFNELSYVAFPWLVPSVRIEYLQLSPDGSPSFNEVKVLAGAAALVRPNIKLTLVGQIESASGAPTGGWGPWGGFAAPVPNTDGSNGKVTELESIELGLAFAF